MSQPQQNHSSIGKTACNRIHSITGAQVQHLIQKLDVINQFLPSTLPLIQLASEEDYTLGEVKGGGGKHVLQECSIIGHLRQIGAFDTDDASKQPLIAVELGAGTGRLSERLQQVSNEEMTHILVDRQEFASSQCRDGKMRRRANDASSICRVVADIATFDLEKYCREQNRCLCLSKHLCGPACDLTIAALERIMPSQRPPFAIATCCHYLCTFDVFAGKQYWLNLGLTEDDFEVAVAVSQWYSLKKKVDVNVSVSSQNDDFTPHQADPSICFKDLINNIPSVLKAHTQTGSSTRLSSEEFERTFSSEQKSGLGENVKRLLDILRVVKLQCMGYKADLVLYTNRSIENRLIVGTTKAEISLNCV